MRFAAILLVALAVNFGLYVLMEGMISRDRVRALNLYDAQTIEFVRTNVDDETKTKDRRRRPPPKPQAIERPRAEVQEVAQRSELPADFEAYTVSSLLGEGAGVALGARIVDGTGESMRMVMATDLTPLARIPPQYPPAALSQQIEGYVELTFIVTTTGTVREPMVLDARPQGMFEHAALAAVARWRFRPVTEAGQPIAARVNLRVDFEIPD